MPPIHPQMQLVKRLARRDAGLRPGIEYWVRRWILPPAVLETARRLVRRNSDRKKPLSTPEHPTPFSEIVFPNVDAPVWVPWEKTINEAGQAFTSEQHHFSRYLESGFDDFVRFYRIHQPTTTPQVRFLTETLQDYAPADHRSVPWHNAPPRETATLARNPGLHGPVSSLELATQATRLDEVRHSIEKYGFLEGRADRPGGQLFVHDNGDFRFVIDSGNHRIAALVHLGWGLVPIRARGGYYPVRLRDLDEWPGVVDGRFSRETARAMFEALFRPIRQQLLPGW